ncbi:Vesicle coat complex COPII, subunit SEC13 [Pseudoloma neurophilia]|uniref:Vesicle coat complex COPII, subunit SEC13 n=1 Tax=Pseudoloma neurophilia TaxID=146866 RepID=A0A0R0M2A0_9MICR|nr:Vesicle coat complex COPII, subunit SEC13 [Pseudoloma neurophilia]
MLSCTKESIRFFQMLNNLQNNDKFDLNLITEVKVNDSKLAFAIFLDENLVLSALTDGDLVLYRRTGESFDLIDKKSVCSDYLSSIEILQLMDVTSTEFMISAGCLDGYLRSFTISRDNLKINEKYSQKVSDARISALSFSNGYLLAGSDNSKAYLFKDGQLLKTFTDHSWKINDVCILIPPFNQKESSEQSSSVHTSLNGLVFATASSDKTVIIYTYGKDQHPNLNHLEEQKEENITKQVLNFTDSPFELNFDLTSMVLTVAYGDKHVECYLPNTDGQFVKTEIEEILE